MNPKIKPRAILYLRQSVAREDSISLELQEDAGRRYAAQQGYEVIGVEADPGISGRTWNRPAVQRVLAMIENRDADVIVLWKWSRLSRSRKDWAIAVDKVEVAGGRIESATEQVDVTTSTGRFARGMLAEFAAFESERIGDTWKEAQARRVARGLPANGLPRFGYEYDRATGYIPHPVNGPILRECYLRFIRGESFHQITLYLRGVAEVPHKHRSRTGIWQRTSVIYLMDSPFAAGFIRYHDELHQGIHQPLISLEEWETYQTLRNQRKRAGVRQSSKSTSAFSAHCICQVCGYAFHITGRTQSGGLNLKCSGVNGLGLHRGGSIIEAKVEAAFMDWLTEYIPKINALAAEHKRNAAAAPTTDAQATLRRALMKANDRLDSLGRKFMDDLIPEESYRRLRDEQLAVVDRLNGQLEDEKLRSRQAPVSVDPVLLELWPEMPTATRQQVVRDLVSRIEIYGPEGRTAHGVQRKIRVVPKWAVDDSTSPESSG
ncbi:recombinase family protein [Glutamicibacter soli]